MAAKVEVAVRSLPLLAEAQLVVVEPTIARLLDDWSTPDAAAVFAAETTLHATPSFFDFEATDGRPIVWEAETWPLPLHLRGALCWRLDGMLSIIPFGSVGGRHPWGGTDYQAWVRCVFLDAKARHWPYPGPGDFVIRPSGEIMAWVDAQAPSICTHHGSIALNLAERVLRVLAVLESNGASLARPTLPRPVRRRAQRAGQRFGLVPVGLPTWPDEEADDFTDQLAAQLNQPCPFQGTHERLNRSHALWHEALDAYDDQSGFLTKLNALLQELRHLTLILQAEIAGDDRLRSWYAFWRARMKTDEAMTWLIAARNRVVHQADLQTHSRALVRVLGQAGRAPARTIEVEPDIPVDELARRIKLSQTISGRVRREGTLVVERRWTVEELPDDEVLDVLAHCYAVLADLVADAHKQRDASIATCTMTADDHCPDHQLTRRENSRLTCMFAGRERRTRRRSLSSGALVRAEVQRFPFERDQGAMEHYAGITHHLPSSGASIADHAAALHATAREIFVKDGYHETIAWLYSGTTDRQPLQLDFTDQRGKFLVMELLASEVDRLCADAVIITGEVWFAEVVPETDPRSELRAGERADKREVLATSLFRKTGDNQSWRSLIRRETDDLLLADPVMSNHVRMPTYLDPLAEVWGQRTT